MKGEILLVDDDQVIRLLVAEYLQSLSYQVLAVEGGLQALDRLLAEDLPAAILLDFQMPVVSGLEVLRLIRRNQRTAALKVIMLSANEATQSILEAEGVQADAYLLKPFDLPKLKRLLETMLA